MTALDELRAAITGDVKLPKSGITATLVLPRVRDFFITGEMPLPVLEEIQVAAKEGKDADEAGLNLTQRAQVAAFNDWCVVESVTALDGEAVELTEDDLRAFEEEDLNAIVLYATRSTPLPGKE